MPTPLRQSTEAELAEFERVCDQLAGFDGRFDPECVDGLLTGLVAGPRRVDPGEWIERLFGETFERAFGDPEAAAAATAALVARWKTISTQLDPERLLDHPDHIFLAPLIWDLSEEERARLVADGTISAEDDAAWAGPGDAWALGVMTAVTEFDEDWSLDAAEEEAMGLRDELLAQVEALAHPPGSPELVAHLAAAYPESPEPPSRDDLIDEACLSLQELRLFWLDHARRPETRTVTPLPGRNDPCYCGSGKKFKKCHGA